MLQLLAETGSAALALPAQPGEKNLALVGNLARLHGLQELREHHAHPGTGLDPALADHGGVLAGRQSGWPQILKTAERAGFPAKPEACDYVDAVFFASRIKHAECLLSVGFFDFVCAPDSVYAAYNAIPSKNKKIIHDVNSDHTMPLATHLAGQKAGTEHIRTAASGR